MVKNLFSLANAGKLGDRLIVAVNTDDSVRRLKGPGRPVNSTDRRMAVLAALGAVDWVVPFAEDTPQRLIAEVLLLNGDTLNRELVKAGLAWHYKKYSADSTYSLLENRALMAKKGLWAEKEPVAPWLWRKR